MKLHNLSAAILVAGTTAFAGAHAAVILNPGALNGDLVAPFDKQLDAAAGGQAAALNVTSIQTSLSSRLDINSAAGSNVGWQESGALVFNTYNGGPQLNGNRTFAGGQYDVYGIFSGTGIGDWAGNQFTVTGISNFTINIYGSPQIGTALTLANPTSGTDLSGGVTAGSLDFLLGTATFAGSFGGTNAQLGLGNTATTQLTADFIFTVADLAYTGAGGYFQDYFMQLNLAGSGSSNSSQSTYTTLNGGVQILTAAFDPDGSVNGATGNIRVTQQQVPEPNALALAGLALVGLVLSNSRKRKV